MLLALAEAVSELGYAKTPVAEVLRRAGVSRETFYEHFANKEQCFLAAYDAAAAMLLGRIGEASGSGGDDPAARLDGVLRGYLAALAEEPAIARTFLVEVYAAGPEALERRVAIQTRFVDAVAALVGARGARQLFACEAIVASITALVTLRVCAGETAELEQLAPSLRDFVETTLGAHGLV
jgi:AcrR family transcriptional regulator